MQESPTGADGISSVGDLDRIWEVRTASVTQAALKQLVAIATEIGSPPAQHLVLPQGIDLAKLLALPLRTRTRNCLLRAFGYGTLDEGKPASVLQLRGLPNFGITALIELMCLTEAALATGALVPTRLPEHPIPAKPLPTELLPEPPAAAPSAAPSPGPEPQLPPPVQRSLPIPPPPPTQASPAPEPIVERQSDPSAPARPTATAKTRSHRPVADRQPTSPQSKGADSPAPWGSPPTPLLPRWYVNSLASTPLPSALIPVSAKRAGAFPLLRTVGDLPGFWDHRSEPLDNRLLRLLVDLVSHRQPPAHYTVIPAGLHPSGLLAIPLRTRTERCLRSAVTRGRLTGEESVTVGDLLVLPNFGLVSLLDLMCVVEAAMRDRFFETQIELRAERPTAEARRDSPPAISPIEHEGNEESPSQPPDAWDFAIPTLQRLLSACLEFRGARTLRDALQSDLPGLADTLGVSEELNDLPISELISGPLLAEEVLRAIAVVRESKSQTAAARLTIEQRLVASPPRSLEDVGKEVDLSRERIRQLEKATRAALESTVGDRLRMTAALVGERLEPVIPEPEFEKRIRSAFSPDIALEVSEADLAISRRLLRGALEYSCTDGVCLNAEATEILETLRRTARELADDAGLVDEHSLRACLPDDDWLRHWDVLIDRIPLHRLTGHFALRDTAKAKAKAALLSIGRPATKEELAAVSGLDPDRAGAQMSLLPSIVRADKHRWGLAEWIDDEYEGIPAEIIQRIREDGGATRLARLLDELPRKFGVSESSVRAYAGTHRFLLRDDYVSLADPSSIALKHLDHVVDGRTVGGSPYWYFKVEDRYLDGYSLVGVPPELVKALECEPDGHTRVPISSPAGCRQLSASWPLASLSGASIGYLADPLSHLGASAGDRVCLVIEKGPSVSLHLGEPEQSRDSDADDSAAEPVSEADPATDRAQATLERMKNRRRGY